MKKVAFYTLGCKVNQYETEYMEERFKEKGYDVVAFSEPADVYIINTCSVTAMADRKSRNAVYRAHKTNPQAIIAVAGCYSQVNPEEFEKMDFVDIVLGNNKDKTVDAVEEFSGNKIFSVDDISKERKYTDISVKEHIGKTRAFMKIEDGCDNFCTYCIIPYARGRVRSRSLEDIKSEAQTLAAAGYTEIVLTGIHLTSYGKDTENTDLADVLLMLEEIDGIKRIRLGSLELTPVMEKIAEMSDRLPKLCPQFHMSLQSGCDSVLKRMKRRYTCENYRRAVMLLRENWEDASVTTDIMTGFPGETEQEHKASLDFAEEIGFSKIHVFPYSRRNGTPAADMAGQLTDKVKRARAAEMQTVANECETRFFESCIGKIFDILVEKRNENGKLAGHAPNYCITEFDGSDDLIKNIVKVKITGYSDGILKGECEKICKLKNTLK